MTERQQRRLAAILAADIAGYSALMGADEARLIGRAINRRDIGKFPNLTCHAGNRYLDRYHDRLIARWI